MSVGLAERFVVALETIAAAMTATTGPTTPAKQAAAEVNAETPAPKKRGRPAKITDEEKKNATDAETVDKREDFLTDPPKEKRDEAKKITVDDVRKALKDYMDFLGGDPVAANKKAREVLKGAGNGAVRLQAEKKRNPDGTVTEGDSTGVLEEAYYGAVIKAAKAAATKPAEVEEF